MCVKQLLSKKKEGVQIKVEWHLPELYIAPLPHPDVVVDRHVIWHVWKRLWNLVCKRQNP